MALRSPGVRAAPPARATAAVLLLLALAVACPAAPEAPASPEPAVLRRPSWGKVIGWVLDAETRRPIAGARVRVEVDGAFPESGRATDTTDAHGRFEVRAPLGKISSRFDWGRLLTMHPISLLLSPRSVTRQTRVVDVVQVNVSAEAPGYQPFVGSVQAARADADRFAVRLDDIWLARTGARLVSFSPGRQVLEAIESVSVEPAVAEPGSAVRIALAARLPLERGFRYRAYATSSAIRLVDARLELRREKGPPDGPVVFARVVRLPRESVDTWTELRFFLVRDGETLLRRSDARVLLQIVRNPAERAAAETVAMGYAQARDGNPGEALRLLARARREAPDYPLAHRLYGDLCLQLQRPQEALEAFRELVRLDPRDWEVARPRYAEALLRCGRPDEALAQIEGAERALGGRVPPAACLLRARVSALHGDFAEADRWLARAGSAETLPDEVVTEIRLARMEAAVRASPENADLRLSYARVLEAARRREEAIAQMRRAVELDPASAWGYIELGRALADAGRKAEALAVLRHATALEPTNPEALLTLADLCRERGDYAGALPHYRAVAERQPRNLRARHGYALCLYATGDLQGARREWLEVVSQARDKGEVEESGIPIPGAGIYFGPKRRLVAGFGMPEAAADAALLEALQELEQRPENALLWQNVGRALLELDAPALAAPPLEKSRRLAPVGSALEVESRFMLAVAQARLGRMEQARAELEAVVAAHPLHPRARLELARLYAAAGDLEKAQAQLLAHARNFREIGGRM